MNAPAMTSPESPLGPPSEPPAASLFLEDIVPGQEWRSATHRITAAEIAAFSALTRDHHPLHTDEAYCRERGFPAVIAHGLYSLSLMEGLKTELRLYESTSIASLGWDKVRFRRAVLAGDVLQLRFRFVSRRESRQPDRGVVVEALELVNAAGEIVVEAEHASLILRRAATAG